MDIKDILKTVDHTLLTPTATWDEIKQLCDEAFLYGTASVCIPTAYVKKAGKYVGGMVKICTVIGFPNGYSTHDVKCYEAVDAVKHGANEIDMVINLGWVKDGKFEDILYEIKEVRQAIDEVKSGIILKVIIETCLLNDEEKIKLCEVVSESGADFIKTSTGFSSGGATFDDIKLIKAHVAPHVKVKAAGGISSIEDAEKFISLGADRLGTSKIVKIAKNENLL